MKHQFVMWRKLLAILMMAGIPGHCLLTQRLSAAPQAQDVVYRIDAAQSTFTVRAFKSGILKTFGHNHTIAVRNFNGRVQLAPGGFELSSLQMTVKADSLQVVDDVSESDRAKIERDMRTKVLETAKYPEIVFKSTKVTAGRATGNQHDIKLDGDLTLHGVTRHLQINAQVTLSDKNLRAHGEFPIKQTDYGMKPISVAGGAIRVKDELKLAFDIVAHP